MASKEKKKLGGLSVDAKGASSLKAAAAPTSASNSPRPPTSPRPPSTAAPQRAGRRVSVLPASAAAVHAVAQTFIGAVSAPQPLANIIDVWMNAAEKGACASSRVA
jgi:hypothetical protein